jgi:hypothetical protein
MAQLPLVPRASFWRSISNRSLLPLLAAVFFTFATVGVVSAMAVASAGRPVPWQHLLAASMMAGLGAVGWVYAFVRDLRFLILVIPLQILGHWGVSNMMDATDGTPVANPIPVALYIALCLIFVWLGFLLFIYFIIHEGVRHLRLQTEMTLAARMHESLVPPIRIQGGPFEAYGCSSASSEVGGDLIDALDGDDGTLFYIADVSGHGVAAGTLMSLVKGAITIGFTGGKTLDSLFADLNRMLVQTSPGNMFVTSAAILLQADGTASYCVAGHPPILHFARRTESLTQLTTANMPLGMFDDRRFEAGHTTFGPGDLFVLLTDGLTEVLDANGHELGLLEAQAIVHRELSGSPEALYRRVMQEIRSYGKQEDDQTLLVIRTN